MENNDQLTPQEIMKIHNQYIRAVLNEAMEENATRDFDRITQDLLNLMNSGIRNENSSDDLLRNIRLSINDLLGESSHYILNQHDVGLHRIVPDLYLSLAALDLRSGSMRGYIINSFHAYYTNLAVGRNVREADSTDFQWVRDSLRSRLSQPINGQMIPEEIRYRIEMEISGLQSIEHASLFANGHKNNDDVTPLSRLAQRRLFETYRQHLTTLAKILEIPLVSQAITIVKKEYEARGSITPTPSPEEREEEEDEDENEVPKKCQEPGRKKRELINHICISNDQESTEDEEKKSFFHLMRDDQLEGDLIASRNYFTALRKVSCTFLIFYVQFL